MLLRHNRVASEINNTSLLAIPNIYWRNLQDQRRWTKWLFANPGLRYISRDFSRTRQKTPFLRELLGLLEVISPLKRRFHVFLVGVGAQNAREALLRLNDVGCTGSIVTSEPILKGIRGRSMEQVGSRISVQTSGISRFETALRNLNALEEYLLSIASPLPSYERLKARNTIYYTTPAS
jgi:hypothetical protein